MISLVIPAYDKENKISQTLSDYHEFLEGLGCYEIIVVCDGCTDNTPVVVRNFADGKNGVMLLTFPNRLGKGGGVIEGFRAASGDLVGFVDADNSVDPPGFKRLLDSIDRGADFAVEALEFMYQKVDYDDKKIWLIGSYNELHCTLVNWNFLLHYPKERRSKIYFPPNVGKLHWQKGYEPDLQELYIKELNKLDEDKVDIVIVSYPEEESQYFTYNGYFTRDYEMANLWQMNYINLIKKKENYRLIKDGVFKKKGVVVEIYERVS